MDNRANCLSGIYGSSLEAIPLCRGSDLYNLLILFSRASLSFPEISLANRSKTDSIGYRIALLSLSKLLTNTKLSEKYGVRHSNSANFMHATEKINMRDTEHDNRQQTYKRLR